MQPGEIGLYEGDVPTPVEKGLAAVVKGVLQLLEVLFRILVWNHSQGRNFLLLLEN